MKLGIVSFACAEMNVDVCRRGKKKRLIKYSPKEFFPAAPFNSLFPLCEGFLNDAEFRNAAASSFLSFSLK